MANSKQFRFDLGKRYNFNIYPQFAGWDTYLRNARVTSITLFDKATKTSDLYTLQATAISYLPPGVSKELEDYTFITFSMPSGIERVIPLEWINIETVQDSDISTGEIQVVVKGTQEEINHLRVVLSSNNYEVVSIGMKTE